MISFSKGFAFLSIICLAAGHSLLGEPKPTTPKECRLGGRLEVFNCPGPCDTNSLLRPGNRNIPGPDRPRATWRRGSTVTIKYQRNNHGPGGFVRLSLVPIAKMMDKEVHSRNAFHYSCWGGGAVNATAAEMGRDRTGYSLTGSDGRFHDSAVGYYTTRVHVPEVIPDGIYAMGWVWYGGIGGSFKGNKPEHPFPNGFFGDYWSCAFVQIRGGPSTPTYRPVFQANLGRYWGDQCWSGADRPGPCAYEPCKPRARFMKPKSFTTPGGPKLLRTSMFRDRSSCSEAGRRRGQACSPGPVPTTPPGPL